MQLIGCEVCACVLLVRMVGLVVNADVEVLVDVGPVVVTVVVEIVVLGSKKWEHEIIIH